MQTQVFCKTKFEGIHCYPDAPKEVKYLRKPHRHIFGVEVQMDVFSDDREVEFIMLKHKVDNWFRSHCNKEGIWKMETLSCEQVGKKLLTYLESEYGTNRQMIITVDEDGENGAYVYED